jgi:hypothetical protein
MSDHHCQKCRENIHPEAERCPHCGHDPSPGWGLRVGAAIAGVLAAIAVSSIPYSVASPILRDTSVTTAAIGVVVWSVLGLCCLWVLRRWWQARNATPATPGSE